MNKLRVLVADDHEQMRRAIADTLAGYFEVVGAVADGRQLVDAAVSLQPDVIVSDISMPSLTGLEAMNELTSSSRKVPFVLVTGNPTTVAHWIELGAAAVVDKMDIARDIAYDLVPAVRAAAAGELYLSRGARARLLPGGSL